MKPGELALTKPPVPERLKKLRRSKVKGKSAKRSHGRIPGVDIFSQDRHALIDRRGEQRLGVGGFHSIREEMGLAFSSVPPMQDSFSYSYFSRTIRRKSTG